MHPLSLTFDSAHRTAKLSDSTSLLQQSLGTRLQQAESVHHTANMTMQLVNSSVTSAKQFHLASSTRTMPTKILTVPG